MSTTLNDPRNNVCEYKYVVYDGVMVNSEEHSENAEVPRDAPTGFAIDLERLRSILGERKWNAARLSGSSGCAPCRCSIRAIVGLSMAVSSGQFGRNT